MVAMLGVLFLLVPIAELVVLVAVAQNIGVLNALGLMIIISMVGAWLCKREGLVVLRRLQQTLDAGGIPHREVVDGFLILLAGALLLVPGFLTDILGVLLLLPPVRIAVRATLVRSFRKRGSFAFRIVDGMGRRVDMNRVHDVTARDVTDKPYNPPELDR